MGGIFIELSWNINGEDIDPCWGSVFMTIEKTQKITQSKYSGPARHQIDSTGYLWPQLAKIEYAFETADRDESIEDYMFNGLMAVISVLDIIHENHDEEITTHSRERFSKNTLSI